jgi:lipoprotein-anchoring transpeptidase ErfK/SrfK
MGFALLAVVALIGWWRWTGRQVQLSRTMHEGLRKTQGTSFRTSTTTTANNHPPLRRPEQGAAAKEASSGLVLSPGMPVSKAASPSASPLPSRPLQEGIRPEKENGSREVAPWQPMQVGKESERKQAALLAPAPRRVLGAQLALLRQGISPGSVDGVLGSQTRAAINAFSRLKGLPAGNESNAITQLTLSMPEPALSTYIVTSNDLARLLPVGKTWLSKSQQERLDYETILELIAEKSQSHPNLIRRLNPAIDWTNVLVGASIQIPNVEFPKNPEKAAFIRIFLEARALEAFDASSNLLAHFPCSIAQRVEKRPVGELHVAVLAPNPNYTFAPEVFPESAEAQELGRKLVLPPGPNNPVGTVWIGLDKPGYGIHGTPRPEDVGRTESHGCFRMANWNAEYLLRLVSVGTPVFVER